MNQTTVHAFRLVTSWRFAGLYRTLGLLNCRTLGLLNCRTLGLLDCRHSVCWSAVYQTCRTARTCAQLGYRTFDLLNCHTPVCWTTTHLVCRTTVLRIFWTSVLTSFLLTPRTSCLKCTSRFGTLWTCFCVHSFSSASLVTWSLPGVRSSFLDLWMLLIFSGSTALLFAFGCRICRLGRSGLQLFLTGTLEFDPYSHLCFLCMSAIYVGAYCWNCMAKFRTLWSWLLNLKDKMKISGLLGKLLTRKSYKPSKPRSIWGNIFQSIEFVNKSI